MNKRDCLLRAENVPGSERDLAGWFSAPRGNKERRSPERRLFWRDDNSESDWMPKGTSNSTGMRRSLYLALSGG